MRLFFENQVWTALIVLFKFSCRVSVFLTEYYYQH